MDEMLGDAEVARAIVEGMTVATADGAQERITGGEVVSIIESRFPENPISNIFQVEDEREGFRNWAHESFQSALTRSLIEESSARRHGTTRHHLRVFLLNGAHGHWPTSLADACHAFEWTPPRHVNSCHMC